MTISELYTFSKNMLSSAGNPSSSFDSMCLVRKFFSINRQQLIVSGNIIADKITEQNFISAVKQRSEGYPLQYIIGKWDFMDNEFYVSDGVLIPRDDTEVVVNACINAFKGKNPKFIIDLCSGSGAIAVTLAKKYPNTKIYALELSDKAFHYLKKNIIHNYTNNIIAINDDIFTAYNRFDDGTFDLIVSNPPYIKTDVIPTLQKEVQYEPLMALDGGNDGLSFYRIISEKWLSKLKVGGTIALETGEEQAKSISTMLTDQNIANIEVLKDIQNLDRAILGTKSE